MDNLFSDFILAHNAQPPNGGLLASTLSPESPVTNPGRLHEFLRSTNQYSVKTDVRYKLQYNPEVRLGRKEAAAWVEVYVAFYKFVSVLLEDEQNGSSSASDSHKWGRVYDNWKEVVGALYKGYQGGFFAVWTIPCLYLAGKYLRVFAIKADEGLVGAGENDTAYYALQEGDEFKTERKNDKLEDAARQINRLFALCISDRYVNMGERCFPIVCLDLSGGLDIAKVSHTPHRNPLEESRKWALYYIATLLFKTHFRLNSISLSKNILRSLQTGTSDMPPWSAFPRSHQVSFQYYCGVICFLDEDYVKADDYLSEAFAACPANAGAVGVRNRELILIYLIPTRLLTSRKLPSRALLDQHPGLVQLFQPLVDSIRRGNLSAFNAALENGEDQFVNRRVYLTLERGRDIILRNVFRKVFIAGGFEPPKEGDGGTPSRRTRVPIHEFAAALSLAGAEVGDGEGGIDSDEVECLIANAIYKVC